MATENERELPTPLSADEVKDGIAYKVADAVRAALDKYGPMYGNAHTKFRCSGKLVLTLDNFGLIAISNHTVDFGDAIATADETLLEVAEVEIDIPETPPNVFRKETEQPVPTMVIERGRPVEKAVLYQQPKRGRGRPPRVQG